MKRIIVDPLSLTSLPIKIRLGENCLAVGTAFIYLLNNKHYLITAGHNITGTHPETSVNIGIPDNIQVFFHSVDSRYHCQIINLYDDNGIEAWLKHPTHGTTVDVVVIPFVPDENCRIHPINSIDFSEIPIRMGMDVFVIGFPHGYTTSPTILPIWKRGSIATEHVIDLEDLPKFYVDTGTAKAMSGSPVIARHTGIYSPSGKFDSTSWIGSGDAFLGVYSGRLIGEAATTPAKDSIYDVQLGIVWKKNVIDEILHSKLLSSNEIDNVYECTSILTDE